MAFDPEMHRVMSYLIPFAESVNSGVIIGDAGRIVYANEEYCRMSGRDPEQVLGRYVWDLYSVEAAERLREIMKASVGQAKSRYEFYIERADGTRLPVMTTVGQLEDLGGPPGLVIVTVTDIADLKNAHSEIERQADRLRRHTATLETEVRRRTIELYEANFDSMYMLAVASEAHDTETGRHVRRIQHLAEAIAVEMGLEMTETIEIGYSALLHDIGKMRLPEAILHKPGPLTDEEFMKMRQHTIEGERILGMRPFFALARRIARSHHERVDGSGYPDGLMGDNIPLAARIVAVADVFDALVNRRTYKPAWPAAAAREEVFRLRQNLLDREAVDAFIRLMDRGDIDRIMHAVNEEPFTTRAPV